MAREPNLHDLGEAEKGVREPPPVSFSHRRTMSDTAILISPGHTEKDHYPASVNARILERTELLQKLESLRKEHRQFVEDWLVKVQAFLLKDLPPSYYFDQDAILELKIWLLEDFGSSSHQGDDFRTQLMTRLSEALKPSGQSLKPKSWPQFLLSILVHTMALATLTYMVFVVGFISWKFHWYDNMIQAVGYLPFYMWTLSQCRDRTSWIFRGLLACVVVYAVFMSVLITHDLWVHFHVGSL
ncbi:hypothetical protein PG991_013799 [Apiospora marii]|uniref:GPI ethanolamine phosphate transferase 1 n=1 Tax=Apiospora marii TaxID=335849 RepID=A0ABR1R7U1_9PEZI